MQRPDPKKTKTDWNWSTYFAAKKQKLQLQFVEDKSGLENVEDDVKYLFNNVGIFVNGYTNPTAIELKAIMSKHGGVYYEYMCDRVTHIIASNLAHSKALILKNTDVIKPEWIVDSLKEKKLLGIDNYILRTSAHDKAQNKLTDFMKKPNGIFNLALAKKLKTKRESEKFVLIDLEEPAEEQEIKKQDSNSNKKHYEDYKCFKAKLLNFKSLDKFLTKSEIEIECLKNLLDDWIFWTSKNTNLNKSNKIELINDEDLNVFRGYLFYVLNILKDFEKLALIMRVFKRLIQKNGSLEWIENFKEIKTALQTEFYEKHNSTIKFD